MVGRAARVHPDLYSIFFGHQLRAGSRAKEAQDLPDLGVEPGGDPACAPDSGMKASSFTAR